MSWYRVPRLAVGDNARVGRGNALVILVHRIAHAVIAARKMRPIVARDASAKMVGAHVAKEGTQLIALRLEHVMNKVADAGPPHRSKVATHHLEHTPGCRLPGLAGPSAARRIA